MKIAITGETNMGKKRTNNEDMGLVQNQLVCDDIVRAIFDTSTDDPVIAAVADGMGGREDGEIASMFVIEKLREWREVLPQDADANAINTSFDNWIMDTNKKLREMSSNRTENRRMGSTLVGMVFADNAIVGFNVGDSRLYRLRDGWLRQISKDHSQRNLKHDNTIASNIIYNCFGAVKDTFADYFNLTDNVNAGDVYLICSDGLSDLLDDDTLEELLNKEATTSQLIAAANEAGGKDNITVVMVQCS